MLVLGLVVPLLSGCSLPYVVRMAAGQVDLMARARPIQEAQRDLSLGREIRDRLAEVQQLLAFARQRGFDVGSAYRTFVDLGGEPLVHVLSAAPPDRLEAYTWSFPFAGRSPYKGFFDEDAVRREQRVLEQQGLETRVAPAPAYSTLGWFPDPVSSSFLTGPRWRVIETLLHELTHRTVYIPGDSRFNENLASFVGEQATMVYLDEHGADDVLTDYQLWYEDDRRFHAIAADLKRELAEAFKAPELGVRMARRKILFALANDRIATTEFRSLSYRGLRSVAWSTPMLLGIDLYKGESGLFQQLFDACDGSFSRFFEVLRHLPAGDTGADRLRAWLSD